MLVCPKCKAEYREGCNVCSDCAETLIISEEIKYSISKTGIGLIKFGLVLLFVSFFEIILLTLTMMDYDISAPMSHISPIIFLIIMIELVLSISVIIWGTKHKVKVNCKD